MALSDNLNTNELKNAAGVEVEFTRFGGEGRTRLWQPVSVIPALPQILTVQHREIGAGFDRRRQSNITLYISTVGTKDATKIVKNKVSVSCDVPVGNINDFSDIKYCLACVGSLLYTNGTNTFVYDGSTPGAAALANGTI